MTETVESLREMIREDTKLLAQVETRRTERMKRARALGATAVELAEDIGKTPGRVSQMAPRPKKSAAPPAPVAPAGPVRRALEGDELPKPFQGGAVERIKATLSGLTSDRWARKWEERSTIFVDLVTGAWHSPGNRSGRIEWRDGSAAALLDGLPEKVERVYLVGGRPGVTADSRHLFDSEADAVRVWFLADTPGWSVQKGGHYIADEDNPIGRWERDGRGIEVARASSWFGEGTYSVAEAARAWFELREMIAAEFTSDAILLTTPASTGRDLWRRSIGNDRRGKGKTYPVLSDELRQLIQSTSGQGRREIVPGEPGERIGQFVQYDMRFAYAALAWGMPVGEPTMWTKRKLDQADDEARERMLMQRGRWLVRAHVPSNWDRVGLLGAPATGKVWTYPAEPGQAFTTWASGAEISLAQKQGWRLDITEGFTFKEDKPLEGWRTKLTTMYQGAETDDRLAGVVGQLVRAALRSMVLMTIGAFSARSHMVSRSMPVEGNADRIPKNRPVREVAGLLLWEEETERSEWMKRTDHPEWSAEIWARCRTRLLTAPTGTAGVSAGALHVPPGTVLGMRTDALYLSVDPEWSDDGAIGRYRLKGKLSGDMERPTTDAALETMKRKAAENV